MIERLISQARLREQLKFHEIIFFGGFPLEKYFELAKIAKKNYKSCVEYASKSVLY